MLFDRTDLRLNYLHLEQISERINSYYDALEGMKESLKSLKSFLKDQESEAVSELKNKLEDANIDVTKKKDTLEQLKKILNLYIKDMRALVDAETEGSQTRVDTLDIGFNFTQIQ